MKYQKKQKLINIYNTIKSVAQSDVIDKLMYTRQSFQTFQPIHALLSCYVPSYYSTRHKPLENLTPDKCSWTSAINKFLSQRSNISNINTISNLIFTNISYSSEDIHTLSETILFHLLNEKDGSIEEGFKYMNAYNISFDDIDKLITINKLSNKYKSAKFSSQVKKIFLKN